MLKIIAFLALGQFYGQEGTTGSVYGVVVDDLDFSGTPIVDSTGMLKIGSNGTCSTTHFLGTGDVIFCGAVEFSSAVYFTDTGVKPTCASTNVGQLFFDTTTAEMCMSNGSGGYTWVGFGSIGGGAGDALTSNSLAQFAATTSAELAGVLSDEQGTGAFVLASEIANKTNWDTAYTQRIQSVTVPVTFASGVLAVGYDNQSVVLNGSNQLTTAQDIRTTASPTFASTTLSANGIVNGTLSVGLGSAASRGISVAHNDTSTTAGVSITQTGTGDVALNFGLPTDSKAFAIGVRNSNDTFRISAKTSSSSATLDPTDSSVLFTMTTTGTTTFTDSVTASALIAPTISSASGTLTVASATSFSSTIALADPGTKPTCDSSQQGKIFRDASTTDTVEICAQVTSGVFAWRNMISQGTSYTFGDGVNDVANVVSVDFNSANLKITSSQIDTIQDIGTNAFPFFNGVAVNSLTMGDPPGRDRPTCDSSLRGRIWTELSTSPPLDRSAQCLRNADGSFAWIRIAASGGTVAPLDSGPAMPTAGMVAVYTGGGEDVADFTTSSVSISGDDISLAAGGKVDGIDISARFDNKSYKSDASITFHHVAAGGDDNYGSFRGTTVDGDELAVLVWDNDDTQHVKVLRMVNGDTPTADLNAIVTHDGALIAHNTNGVDSLTSAEIDQLENIGSETITSGDWAKVAAIKNAATSDLIGISKYVVGVANAPYTSIQTAIDACVTDEAESYSDPCLIIVLPGTYGENVTLSAHVALLGMGGSWDMRPVISGKVTADYGSASGPFQRTATINNFRISSPSGDYGIDFTGTGAQSLYLNNVSIYKGTGTGKGIRVNNSGSQSGSSSIVYADNLRIQGGAGNSAACIEHSAGRIQYMGNVRLENAALDTTLAISGSAVSWQTGGAIYAEGKITVASSGQNSLTLVAIVTTTTASCINNTGSGTLVLGSFGCSSPLGVNSSVAAVDASAGAIVYGRASTQAINFATVASGAGLVATSDNLGNIFQAKSSILTSLAALTSDEVTQLGNINSSAISSTEWGYLASMNQGVATSDSVAFGQATIDNLILNGSTIITSTGNLVIAANGSSNVLMSSPVKINESMVLADPFASKPTCDSSARGTVWRTDSSTGTEDLTEICNKLDDESYAWVSLTSSGGGGGGGGGGVTTPGTTTDRAIAVFDGTDGSALVDTALTIDSGGGLHTSGRIYLGDPVIQSAGTIQLQGGGSGWIWHVVDRPSHAVMAQFYNAGSGDASVSYYGEGGNSYAQGYNKGTDTFDLAYATGSTAALGTGTVLSIDSDGIATFQGTVVTPDVTLDGASLNATVSDFETRISDLEGSGGGGGGLTGPVSTTDTAVAIWDGNTGEALENTSVIVDSEGSMNWTNPATAYYPGDERDYVTINGRGMSVNADGVYFSGDYTRTEVGVAISSGRDGNPNLLLTNTGNTNGIALYVEDGKSLFVSSDGIDVKKITMSDSGTKPTCNSTRNGVIFYDAGTTDTLEFCAQTSSGTYQWKDLMGGGGGGGGGGGDVVGPATATDNAIAVYDGTTGELLKDSTLTISGNNLVLVSGGTVDGVDVSEVLDQDVRSSASPTFDHLTVAHTATVETIVAGNISISANAMTQTATDMVFYVPEGSGYFHYVNETGTAYAVTSASGHHNASSVLNQTANGDASIKFWNSADGLSCSFGMNGSGAQNSIQLACSENGSNVLGTGTIFTADNDRLILASGVRLAQGLSSLSVSNGSTSITITNNVHTLNCTGSSSITSIAGGLSGMQLTLIANGSGCTLTDNGGASDADTLAINGDWVGAYQKTITLIYANGYWNELSRSAN